MKKMKMIGVFLFLVLGASGMLCAETPSPAPAPVPGEQVRHSDDSGQSSTVTEVKTYDELRHAISQTRAASRVRVQKSVEQERVREAWEIGRLIDTHVLQHKERAGYDRQILVRLAKDLGTSKTELYYMLEFARAYPIFPLTGKLSWSDYRELLSVNGSKERNAIAEEAVRNQWTQKELRQAIRKVKSSDKREDPGTEELPSLAPGKPGTYRVILAKSGPFGGELALDLGFSCYYRPAGEFPFKEGDIITSAKDTKGYYSLQSIPSPFPLPRGEGSALVPLPGGEDKGEGALDTHPVSPAGGRHPPSDLRLLYTYEAWVTRVLDGDTIEAVVDLGFGFVTTQTLRLRGIDCPELVTRDGAEAKEFVEKMLKGAPVASPFGKGGRGDLKISPDPSLKKRGVEIGAPVTTQVLIKTTKSDKYDRYLADVFLVDAQGRQVYLNNLLLEQGHAVRVQS